MTTSRADIIDALRRGLFYVNWVIDDQTGQAMASAAILADSPHNDDRVEARRIDDRLTRAKDARDAIVKVLGELE